MDRELIQINNDTQMYTLHVYKDEPRNGPLTASAIHVDQLTTVQLFGLICLPFNCQLPTAHCQLTTQEPKITRATHQWPTMLLATGQMKTRATNQTKENGIRSIYAINKETQTETHKCTVLWHSPMALTIRPLRGTEEANHR